MVSLGVGNFIDIYIFSGSVVLFDVYVFLAYDF